MRPVFCLFFFLCLASAQVVSGQQKNPIDLYALAKNQGFQVAGRAPVAFDEQGRKGVRYTESEESALAWLTDQTFGNGVIELDIKGRDALQKCFLGIAFHGVDDKTMDVVYFRPFNFQNTDPVRKIHAVQYVSVPEFDWAKLREEQNGKYEKAVVPAPGGNDWFHAKIVVHHPRVVVYVNGNSTASLTVDKLNTRTKGKIGLWIGPSSLGEFANLTITGE